MKKLLLFFAVALLVGCAKDHTEDINAINNRLDVLEQTTLPSIEEQIETINLAIDQLKEVDTALRKEIESLKSSAQDASNKIAALEQADKNIDSKITELRNYVNSEIKKAKDDAAAAYATCDELKSAKTELTNLKSSVVDLESSLTTKIDNAVSVLDSKIADLEARLKAVEDKVESLLARIQSVSYIPEYADGKVLISRFGATSSGELSFRISPKDAVVELEKVWSTALSCEAFYPKTRAVSFVKLAVTEYVADAESGVITVKISGDGLSEEFFAGTQEAKVALVISDGNNQIVSDYADAVGKEIVDEIWYTTIDEQPLAPNKEGVDIFGANIVSNTYGNGKGVIVFDAPVTSIGGDAFYKCTSLTNITIPNSVTSIGEYAFRYCTSLTAFYGKYASADNRCLIVDGVLHSFASAGLTQYTIPDSVTSIGNGAFRDCTSLTSVTIPDSVTSIGEYAFRGCSLLKTFYGKYASSDNRCLIVDGVLNSFAPAGLTEYTIPDNVTSIGYRAFNDCTSLTSITIPGSVTSIGYCAFYGCTSLTAFYGKYASADNRCLVVNGVLHSFAPAGLTEYTIPDGVTSIVYSAFYNCNSLTSITIGNSVTSIGGSAFSGCTSLKEVYCKPTTPPAGNSYMFNNNASGRQIYVPRESVDAYKTAEYWSNYASDIEGYNFENGEVAAPQPANNEIWYTSSDGAVVTPYKSDVFGANIVSNTYENGKGVIEFDGPVTSIGDFAFHKRTSLTSVTIGDSVTSIGKYAFAYCPSLTAFYGKYASADNRCLIVDGVLKSFAPAGLTEYTIPDSVTSIGEAAFRDRTSLASITIPNSVTSIGYDAFFRCTSLTSITIPDSVTLIGVGAFYECTSLKAFYGKFASSDNRCLIVDGVLTSFAPAGLTEYTIPNSVTSIGENAFSKYTSLTSITIPNSVTSIGVWAFFRCTSLTSITIPDSVTLIGNYAFYYCTSLKEVYCKPTTPPAGDIYMFNDNASGRKIYVPRESVDAYKTAEYWSNYASDIEGYDFYTAN